jgi:hypothetical protein
VETVISDKLKRRESREDAHILGSGGFVGVSFESVRRRRHVGSSVCE